nr:hypothetical protein [Comamonas piscis]
MHQALGIGQGIKLGTVGDGAHALCIQRLLLLGAQGVPDLGEKGFFVFIAQALLEAARAKKLLLHLGCGCFAPRGCRNLALAALPSAVVVHRQDFEKNLSVLFGVVASGHEHAQNGRTHQNQGLAAPPFAQAGERLAGAGLALFVGLGRKAGNGELGFDESGHGLIQI